MGSEVDQKPLASDDEILNSKSDLIYITCTSLIFSVSLHCIYTYHIHWLGSQVLISALLLPGFQSHREDEDV